LGKDRRFHMIACVVSGPQNNTGFSKNYKVCEGNIFYSVLKSNLKLTVCLESFILSSVITKIETEIIVI